MAKGSLERQAGNQGKGAMEKCVSSQERVLPTAKASLAAGPPVVSSVSYTVFLSFGLGSYRKEMAVQRHEEMTRTSSVCRAGVQDFRNTGAFSVPERSPMQENEISPYLSPP